MATALPEPAQEIPRLRAPGGRHCRPSRRSRRGGRTAPLASLSRNGQGRHEGGQGEDGEETAELVTSMHNSLLTGQVFPGQNAFEACLYYTGRFWYRKTRHSCARRNLAPANPVCAKKRWRRSRRRTPMKIQRFLPLLILCAGVALGGIGGIGANAVNPVNPVNPAGGARRRSRRAPSPAGPPRCHRCPGGGESPTRRDRRESRRPGRSLRQWRCRRSA